MKEDERMLINWPTTRKVMIEQLKRAMKMYGAYKLSNEELMYFVENYMNNFGHLFFKNDFEIHPSIRKALGKRNTWILACIVERVYQKEFENIGNY